MKPRVILTTTAVLAMIVAACPVALAAQSMSAPQDSAKMAMKKDAMSKGDAMGKGDAMAMSKGDATMSKADKKKSEMAKRDSLKMAAKMEAKKKAAMKKGGA